jgi:hypothetical protein
MQMLRRLPIVLFMALLLGPLTSILAGMAPAPLEEYRALASRPEVGAYFNPATTDLLGFTSQFNAWFSDRFPTRPFWVRLHTQLLYSLFNQSSEVYIGKDGWLFYRSVIDVEDPVLEKTAPGFRSGMSDSFARLTELLAQRGITLYVMPLALKPRYYPEFLPASANHARGLQFYDKFMDGAVADGRVRIIDTRKLLEDAKQSGLQIFHKTDFHWTDPAAALAFGELLRGIGMQEEKMDLVASWDYEIVPLSGFSGGQARALPLFTRLTEETVDVVFKGPETNFEYTGAGVGIESSGVATPDQAERFASLLIYGDSFTDAGERVGTYSFFKAYARARLRDHSLVDAYSNRLADTRYILIEYITGSTFYIDEQVTALIQTLEQNPDL